MTTLDIALQSSTELRLEEHTVSVEHERDFWMKKAEKLHEQIEAIFEHAKAGDTGAIRIMRRGQEVTLYVRTDARTEPENLRDDDRFNKGVLYAQDILNKLIGDPEYVASDGSEDYDTDLGDTILNQLAAAGLYDKEECRFATLAIPQS